MILHDRRCEFERHARLVIRRFSAKRDTDIHGFISDRDTGDDDDDDEDDGDDEPVDDEGDDDHGDDEVDVDDDMPKLSAGLAASPGAYQRSTDLHHEAAVVVRRISLLLLLVTRYSYHR